MTDDPSRPDPRTTSNESFDARLDRYAEILVRHGAGLGMERSPAKAPQEVFVHAEVAHRELALRVAEAAYDAGAGHVSVRYIDPLLVAKTIRRGPLERLETMHTEEAAWLNDALSHRAALISLRGDEDPRLMPELADEEAERHAVFTRGSSQKGKAFLHHGVNRRLCPWVVAGAATPGWGKVVFPDLDEDAALARLWEEIFHFTGADRADAVEHLEAKDRRLHGRRRLLDELAIREIHVEGPGTDLRVGLSERARWLGGSKETIYGQRFNANVPSEENYTTPDRRCAEGTLRATMPFRTKSGVLVEGLEMRFADGRMVDFAAERGEAGFRRWVDTDDGARCLGELALVGGDSPIARSGLFFEHTLFDENAWSHAALGQSYSTALRGGEEMGQSELEEVGANASAIHTDVMFGSPEVTIRATESRDGEVLLIENGRWTDPFADPD